MWFAKLRWSCASPTSSNFSRKLDATHTKASRGHGWNQSMTVQFTSPGNRRARTRKTAPTGEKHMMTRKFRRIQRVPSIPGVRCPRVGRRRAGCAAQRAGLCLSRALRCATEEAYMDRSHMVKLASATDEDTEEEEAGRAKPSRPVLSRNEDMSVQLRAAAHSTLPDVRRHDRNHAYYRVGHESLALHDRQLLHARRARRLRRGGGGGEEWTSASRAGRDWLQRHSALCPLSSDGSFATRQRGFNSSISILKLAKSSETINISFDALLGDKPPTK
ncbi:hypothetical protein PR003_g33405 [Phytophthora rubi]|nr:hypothetical protein PR003_g33405 [Phytophthora rubi]